jgi:hypothetical protein
MGSGFDFKLNLYGAIWITQGGNLVYYRISDFDEQGCAHHGRLRLDPLDHL